MNKINVRVTFSYVHAIFCETVEINHPRLKKIISNSNFNFTFDWEYLKKHS